MGGFVVAEMRVLIQTLPILLFPNRFRSNHTHQNKKKGVRKFAPQDFLGGPNYWAKMVHFWKPWEHAFWPSPECREPFSMLPRHALSSILWFEMPEMGRGGQRRQLRLSNYQGFVLSCLTTNPTRPDDFNASLLKNS
jgi:hypothetical protein